jgi:pimeloyl-ACP methyl ester carboxylesterase
MSAPLTLPRLAWGDPTSSRRALLVHGLGSNGALMWRYAVHLSGAGWYVEAVDLRGHGTAPRALDYTIPTYAADLLGTRPAGHAAWDLVIGHSLGGAASVVASARDSAWTRHLVLIDPALRLAPRDREIVRKSQADSFADPSERAVRKAHPDWHENDIELKAVSAQQASRWAVEQTSTQNPEWDVLAQAAALTAPTHIIGSDPEVYSIFTGRTADEVLTNRHITMSVVHGAGHSPHRDQPQRTLSALDAALNGWRLSRM